MCLILFAHRVHPDYPLVLAANRDEYFNRPTALAHYWADAPDVLGGRDLSAKGSWLAVSRRRRLAAVTNYRDPDRHSAPRSRGLLVSDFVLAEHDTDMHIEALQGTQAQYGGFNLLLFDGDAIHYASNKSSKTSAVTPGIHGLSNHLLNTPWPKVEVGKSRLRAALDRPPLQWRERLFELLADRTRAPDEQLPHTGVSTQWERELSPAFISTEGYGTRASTLIILRTDGQLEFSERAFDEQGQLIGERDFMLQTRP